MKKELLVCIGFILCAFMSTTSYGETTTSKTDTICLGYSGKIVLSDTAAHILAECLARDRSAVGQNFKVEISSNRINSYSTIKGVKLPIPTNIVLGSNPETELVTLTLKYDRKITSVGNNAIPKISPEFGSKDIDKVMWDLFGRIVVEGVKSETFIQENSLVINTTHEITVSYVVLKSMQEDEMPIISGGICFDKEGKITLNVNSKFTSFAQQWIAETLIIDGSSTASSVKLQVPSSSAFLHTVIYTVEGCNSSKSDTIVIGKQSTKPTIADTSLCIPTGEPSLTTSIKDPSPFLIYHWTLKNNQGEKVDSKNGTTVDLAIPPYGRGEITVYASGGCDTSFPTMTTIHRSINPENIKLELEEDSLCLFAGDTVHFKLSQKVEEDLIWNKPALWVQIPPKTGEDTNFTRSYILQLAADSIYATDMLSVYGKYCSDDTSSTSVFFRKDLKVSLIGDICVRADSTTIFTADAEKNQHAKYQWTCNFAEIEEAETDSATKAFPVPMDAGKGLFVTVKTTECRRIATDTLFVFVKASTPEINETLWDEETACMPLGMTDSIHLQVQAQNGIDGFTWILPSDWEIRSKDSVGIKAEFLAPLSMQGDSVTVGVYANSEACGSSDTIIRKIGLYGANVNPDWGFGYIFYDDYMDDPNCINCISGEGGFAIGFIDSNVNIFEPITNIFEESNILPYPELNSFTYAWFKEPNSEVCLDYDAFVEVIESLKLPINFFRLLIKKSENQCASQYTISIPMRVPMSNTQKKEPKHESKSENFAIKTPLGSSLTQECRVHATLVPNPAKEKTMIRFDKMDAPLRIEVLNSMGICIYQTTAYNNELEINTSLYSSGIYFVRCINTQNGKSFTKKLLIR